MTQHWSHRAQWGTPVPPQLLGVAAVQRQAERQRLLIIIEEGFGTINGFNETVRSILQGMLGVQRKDHISQESEARLRGLRLWQHASRVAKHRATPFCSKLRNVRAVRRAHLSPVHDEDTPREEGSTATGSASGRLSVQGQELGHVRV